MMSSAEHLIVLKSNEKVQHRQINEVGKYLDVSSTLEDDLLNTEDARLSGTCEWFTAKENYVKWIDHTQKAPHLLWITGKPAAGKTVLAGYITDHLQKHNVNCSYFFFKYGDKYKSRLSFCLRSLAFQMACSSTQVRETLLEMQKDGIKLDNDNERTVWRKIFLCGIFQKSVRSHFWVIDGLDECVNFASLFDTMLAQLNESIPLRILITSRESLALETRFQSLGTHRIRQEKISAADTFDDIKLVVEAKANSVLLKTNEDRTALVEKVLENSQGSFLWTVLVLRELSNAHGEQEIKQAIENMPRDMGPLYQRTLESMTGFVGGKKLAKAVLIWVACVIRPLTIMELEGALKMDIADSFPKLEESILTLCGHLVNIDKFGKVQMVHGTAREFLLNDDLESEFAVRKTEAHTRIARACLKYLNGEEMRPPRTNRHGSARNKMDKRAKFSVYACAAFSYHLAKADPLAIDVLKLTKKFLRFNVLSWIEVVAQTQSLVPLIRAAKNIKSYLNSCATERSPLDGSMQMIKGWSTDLIRIVAKFPDALITSPSAIYSLILPFCPPESVIYKTERPGRCLSVLGLSETRWDDRLVCIDFREGQTSALCHGDEFFAVGLTTGMVALYNATSFQEFKVLNHGEAVRFLQFKSKAPVMASCGIKTIKVWDAYSGEILHTFKAVQRFIGLTFDGSLLVAISSENYLASWDLDNNGAPQPDRPWKDCSEDVIPSRRTPCAVSLAVSQKMLAVAYSGRPITLWDLEEDTYYGACGKKLANGNTSTHVVTAMLFNPNPNIELLAVSYLDGELVLLDPFDDQEIESLRANCHVLAVSPDGRLLAGGAGGGTIQIYEFDTLNLLYRVSASNFYIKQLAFSSDGLHFSDIRGSHCNIWEPVDLLRNSVSDEISESTSTSFVDVVASDSQVKISAVVVHPGGDVIFCGKDNGLISLYDLKTGAEIRTLYRHKSLIHTLAWWPQRESILSVDASNRICSWNLKNLQKVGWMAQEMVFQSRLDSGNSIIQVLPSEAAGKFIVSTRKSDHLWGIDGHEEHVRTYSDEPGIRKWIQHQQSPLYMMCFEGTTARIYAWRDWSEVASVLLPIDTIGLQLKSVNPYMLGSRPRILLEWSELDGSPDTRGLQLLDTASLSIDNITADEASKKAARARQETDEVLIPEKFTAAATSQLLLSPQLMTLARNVAHVIGLTEANHLIFLNTHSWICSTDLEDPSISSSSMSYSRHFLVPYEWLAGTRNALCAVVMRDLIFARNDDVAIVKGGLEYVKKVNMEVDHADHLS